MRSGTSRAKRWLSLGLLLVMVLSFAAPTFALPNRWYKKVYVHKNPTKMVYEVGEYMDLAGLELWGDIYDGDGNFVWTNTDMKSLESKYFKYSPSKFTKPGKQKVTFSCHCIGKSGNREWLSASITVTVNQPGDAPVEYYTDIFVAAQPKKLIYTVGESFKTSGLSISGHVFNEIDQKKHTVPKLSQKNMKISPSKFTKSGKQNVKLSLYLLAKNGEHKWFSTTVQVLVEKGDVKITKHPTGETVNEGGACTFIARADNDDSRHWYFTKNGVVVDANNAASQFPGLHVSGTTSEKLKLSHIPAAMNGWSAYCVFYGQDSSATSHKAGIVVLSDESPALPPDTEPPAEATPKAIDTTPPPTDEPEETPIPDETQAPATPQNPQASATPKPTRTPKPTQEPAYAQGIHCTINGESKVPVVGDTVLACEAEDIEGFVFDHWEINGQPDYESGASASFVASEAAVIRAFYHERKVLRTVNCFFQLLTKNHNASGKKYTEFDFEDSYYSPVTKSYCPPGTLSCYVTAVIPKKAQIDYWLINGVKYQFPDNNIVKFRIVDLNEATTIEPVFKGKSPTNQFARPAAAEELVYQAPHLMRCINCWGQFMNVNGSPSGKEYREFDFDKTYTNPVTRKKLPGGKLDIFISTKLPKHCAVDTWIINDVQYQFPGTVLKFRVRDLDEATTYEVRFRTVSSSATPTPSAVRIPIPRNPGF